ncbi:hypothetical protein CGCF415_v004620 [Colletotrichum fructicola]|nr:uncharacterized protein CGMCC3_g9534 [Colletotrichum fructicola]KAE9574311.1 hypothetical protein CGMCC3_g9534 [Colletotrichum fructicola]KAF4898790.1 hypothetical protein CGCFRS4_v004194 [Colletotrichum fructicola]KAF4911255.1 hypothetical protein CGCF415_v004620 [Colletotrichum fructicola]KAF4936314.1 hypothetical protein CGCF245_v006834 [Colletotrichum fructicola]
MLTNEVGGSWSPSSSAKPLNGSSAYFDTWQSYLYTGGDYFGEVYVDNLTIGYSLGSSDLNFNATISGGNKWMDVYAGAASEPSKVGFLGLGPQKYRTQPHQAAPGLLEQLKAEGKIDRAAWSLHIGSAALKLPGSLVLGGYEQNRVLGNVGTFSMEVGFPQVFLRDVFMGVETGEASGFPARSNGSFWVDPGDTNGTNYNDILRGATGSAAVMPNPVSPYIYLQPGICEGIAENLGLRFHNDTGLYLWESTRIGSVGDFINSPAYLGFVLSDKTATNYTIKVPFKLLNLTLEPPLVEFPVNYFPCKSTDSRASNAGQLGRAFLQAAFMAVDYEKGVMYIAQAPGPSIEQSVVQRFDDSVVKSNSATTFQTTWSRSWAVRSTVIEDAVEDKGVTKSGIAGIAVGAVAAVVAALWICRRRRKRKQGPLAPADVFDKAVLWFTEARGNFGRKSSPSNTGSNKIGGVNRSHAIEQKVLRQGVNELDSTPTPAEMESSEMELRELDSVSKPVEMDASSQERFGYSPVRSDAPDDSVAHELPASTPRR